MNISYCGAKNNFTLSSELNLKIPSCIPYFIIELFGSFNLLFAKWKTFCVLRYIRSDNKYCISTRNSQTICIVYSRSWGKLSNKFHEIAQKPVFNFQFSILPPLVSYECDDMWNRPRAGGNDKETLKNHVPKLVTIFCSIMYLNNTIHFYPIILVLWQIP